MHRKIALCAYIICLVATPCFGANYCARPTAQGSGNGLDWSNAIALSTAVGDSSYRGHTIYISGESYGSPDFDASVSGTSTITVKKATSSDHVTDTGWNASWGTMAASFGPIDVDTNYWVIDGQSRSGLKTGHGITITSTPQPNTSKCINHRYATTSLTLRYIAFIGSGADGANEGHIANDLIYSPNAFDGLTIQHCYFYDSGRVHILSNGDSSNYLIEYSYFYKAETDAGQHSEAFSLESLDGLITRYNWFEEIQGTAIIACLDSTGATGWEIYGNVFYNCPVVSGGTLGTDDESDLSNSKFYNNTMIGIESSGGINITTGSNNVAYNNIWYNCTGIAFNNISHDYNAYSGESTYSEPHGQSGILSSIFTDYSGADFTLAANTTAGTTLESPYNTDMLGVTRGADGTWDRGAYEYTDAVPTPTPIPRGAASATIRNGSIH